MICCYADSTVTADESTQKEPASTYLSESMSILNSTELPDYTLKHSDYKSSIVDHPSMSDGMDSNPIHPTHNPQTSEAFSPTLSLPSSCGKEDSYTYGGGLGDYHRSQSMPPVNHRYQQEGAYFHTPTVRKQHPHIQRRFTFPPTPGYSLCTPSTSDFVRMPFYIAKFKRGQIHIHGGGGHQI